MLHRIATSLLAAAIALSVSRAAHADLYCGSYLSGAHRPDELTSASSQALATDLRACVCYADCAAVCMTYDPAEGNYACGIAGDPAFAAQGGNVGACDSCISASCGSMLDACYLDN